MSEGEPAHLGLGDGSPGSREAEGEGGEGFYVAQSGRCPDLLVIQGGGGKRAEESFPVLEPPPPG